MSAFEKYIFSPTYFFYLIRLKSNRHRAHFFNIKGEEKLKDKKKKSKKALTNIEMLYTLHD
jgi:hypothetical protein